MQKEKDDLKASIISAFYSAYFQRLEKLSNSDLRKVLDNIDGKENMTDDEMLEAVKRFNTLVGGIVQRGGEEDNGRHY